MAHTNGVPRDLSFQLLQEITNGFSFERQLGSGAYGKVYEGVHQNGERIAVKVLNQMPSLDDKQFMNEFNKLTRLKHPNIVRLVGYCYDTKKMCVPYNGRFVIAEEIRRALCLEYMHNGSLERHLCDEYDGQDWHTRYAIIKGIGNGLKYLHEGLGTPIYHLDLKPANILLDENMIPKLADFGLSRLFGGESTQITNTCLGTRGYLAPEYIEQNIISNKSDIFSLGVVIIKIISGPMGYTKSTEMSPREFIRQVQENWRNRLEGKSDLEQIKKCMEIALRCVLADRHNRPSIGEVVEKLTETEMMSFPRLSLQSAHRLRSAPASFKRSGRNVGLKCLQRSSSLGDNMTSSDISATPPRQQPLLTPLPRSPAAAFNPEARNQVQQRLQAMVERSREALALAMFRPNNLAGRWPPLKSEQP